MASYLCSSYDGCSSCESCNSCNGACNANAQKASSICKDSTSFDVAKGSNAWKTTLEKDDPFLTAAQWNKLISCIDELYNSNNISLPSGTKSFDDIVGNSDIEAGTGHNKFMTASMFNGVRKLLTNIGYKLVSINDEPVYDIVERDVRGGPTGDVIEASLFNDLADFVRHFRYSAVCNACLSNQCSGCNSKQDYCCACVTSETLPDTGGATT